MDVEMWELVYPKRPWTTNAERGWHYQKRAKLVKEWRGAFCYLAMAADIPKLKWMTIEATPRTPIRRFQDIAACNPAVKAAIDGIVDAGVVPDDSQEWLHCVTFYPDIYDKGNPGLIVRVLGVPDV